MEATQKFGPNAVGFHLVTEERQWYIIGYYLAPDDTSTIESVIAVLEERPRVLELLVAGGLNTNLEEP